MAAPTQAYPPWLTPVPSVVTDAAGEPTTSTSIEYLPLTYFGPSIPLGTLWVYGGSVSPVFSVTTLASTTITATIFSTTSPTTTSAIPTTSVTTTSSLSSSSTSTTSFSTTAATSTTSFSATPSASVSSHLTSSSTTSSSILPTPTVSMAGQLSRGQLIGIIVAGILTLIFIFACLIFFWLCYKQRSNRNSRTRFSYITPIDEDYFVIGPGGRSPGEGSPRHSGEEADPFLQRSRGPIAGPSGTQTQEMTQVGPELGVLPPPRMPLPPTGSVSSSGSSSTGASGYGVLLDRPSLGLLPSTPEENVGEHEPLSPDDMQRIQNESVLPSDQDQDPDDEYTGAYAYSNSPLLPPPRLVDPEKAFRPMDPLRLPFKSRQSHLSHQSSFPIDAEEAVTLTARRVKVESVSPHYSPVSTGSPAGPSTSGGGLLDALRLSGLGRLSWFNTSSEPRHSTHSQDYTVEPFTDADIEHGRLRNPNLGQQQVGLGPDGIRPTSNISARSAASGGTLYHDAYSSAPSTPVLALPPRAVTPPEAPAAEQAWMSGSSSAPPPAYEDPYTDSAPGGTSLSTQTGTGDILDTPAPSAIPHFVSSSSTNTSSSIALRNHPYPPGLALVSPKAWANSDMSSTGSSPVHLVSPHMDSPGGGGADVTIDIDILEEEPPNAGEGWRTIASGLFGPAGRRTTFGLPQYVYQPELLSEQGSLHSMRSHLAPSSRSTGSASASRMGGSFGSNSSRPSAYSVASAANNSLNRQGSIGSDGFGHRRVGPISPALSALGPMYRRSQWISHGSGSDIQSGSGSGGSGFGLASVVEQPVPAMVGPPPSAHMTPDRSTIRTVTSGSATLRDNERMTTSPPLSPSFAPWATGLDQDWTPA